MTHSYNYLQIYLR